MSNEIGLGKTQVVIPTGPSVVINEATQTFFNNLGISVGSRYEFTAGGIYWWNQTTGQLLGTLADMTITAGEYYTGSFTSGTVAGNGAGMSQNVFGTKLDIFQRMQTRIRMITTTNVRYWLGIFNQSSLLSGSALKTDLPTIQTIAFRLSVGVDSTWQCMVVKTGGALQGIVDSHVPIDTLHTHLFEIRMTPVGAAFYIDFKQVAVISVTGLSTNVAMPYANWVDNKGLTNAVAIGYGYTFVLGT